MDTEPWVVWTDEQAMTLASRVGGAGGRAYRHAPHQPARPVEVPADALAARARDVALALGTVADLLPHARRLTYRDRADVAEAVDVCARCYAETWQPSWQRAGNMLRLLLKTEAFR